MWHGKASTKYLQGPFPSSLSWPLLHLPLSLSYLYSDEIRVIVDNFTKKALPYEVVSEGSEPSAFWKSLGGKKDYTDKLIDAEVKVFYCDNKLGVFRGDRVFEFAQSTAPQIIFLVGF